MTIKLVFWFCFWFGGYKWRHLRKPRNQTSALVGGSLWTQQTWDAGPTIAYCWPTVYDAGPAVNQCWANGSCFHWGQCEARFTGWWQPVATLSPHAVRWRHPQATPSERNNGRHAAPEIAENLPDVYLRVLSNSRKLTLLVDTINGHTVTVTHWHLSML